MKQPIDADMALRLMLAEPASAAAELGRLYEEQWRELVVVLRANVVLIRVADRYAPFGAAVAPLLEAARLERERVASAMTMLARIAEALKAERVTIVFIKSFQHYPDMGSDIDLLVDDGTMRTDRVIAQAMGARPRRGTPASTFAGKRTYEVPGFAAPIDIHHGRLGLLGEHRALARRIFARPRRVTMAGLELAMPAPEEQLLLQVVDRVYARRHIRASDIIGVKRLAEGPVDQVALRAGAREAGIGRMLSYLVATAEGLTLRATKPHPGAAGLPTAHAGGYPLANARVAASYAATALDAVLAGDVERAMRIAALPALALATMIDRGLVRTMPVGD